MTGTGAALVCASSAVAPRNNGSMQISFFWFLVMRRRKACSCFSFSDPEIQFSVFLLIRQTAHNTKGRTHLAVRPPCFCESSWPSPRRAFLVVQNLLLAWCSSVDEPSRNGLCRGILGRAASFVQ